jgi:hypothetical protein
VNGGGRGGVGRAASTPSRQPLATTWLTLCLALGALALPRCGATAEGGEPSATPASASAGVPVRNVFDAGYRNIEVLGQNLVLELPDAEGWRRERRERQGWEATHAATGSRLMVRTWHADGRVGRGDCERQMRLWRPDLPFLPPELRIDQHGGTVAEYAADVVAGVDASPLEARGLVSIFGTEGRECLCLIFSTSARGEGASGLVAGRLGTMSRLLERARRVNIQARATRIEPQL